MRPLRALSPSIARALRGVLFDLDDTVLTHGALTREAYDALFVLRESGLRLVAVTGRPASWGELVARQWPVDAAVTENGAVAHVREGRAVVRLDRCPEDERRARRARLAEIVALARVRFPDVGLADDGSGRLTDVAWDIGENATIPRERADALAELVVTAGAQTTRSSVHLHASFDRADKASGVVALLRDRFGEDPGEALARYAFVGDSPNDASCFAAFHATFGVANVRAHASRLVVPPRFVADAPMGRGFAEIAATVASLRRSGEAREMGPP